MATHHALAEIPPSDVARAPQLRSGASSLFAAGGLPRIVLFIWFAIVALFLGTFHNRIDQKGRVSLPADFRSEIPDTDQRTVSVFPSPRGPWLEACDRQFLEQLLGDIEKMDLFSDEEEAAAGAILGQCRRLSWDDTGRIVLPTELREFGQLEDQAIFVAMGNRFHIRSPSAHASIDSKRKAQAATIRFSRK